MLSKIAFSSLILFLAIEVSGQQGSAWRGPQRDGIYPDTGLLQHWPEGGPEIMWTIGGLGQGYSSPSFANGKIYVTGMLGETGHVFIIDEEGQIIKRKILVTHMAGDLIGLDAETGNLLWSYPFSNRNKIHANTPIFRDGYLYAFSTDEAGSVKLRLLPGGSAIEVMWENREVNPLGGGAVIVNDHIFTSVYVARRWHGVNILTGESTFSTRELDRGIVIYADGMLYCYSERGELALVRPNPAEFEIVSTTSIDIGSGHHFAHPVIHEGRLFVRRGDGMIVFNISPGN
jgi:outer membrane protein assembly factor BamB